MLRLSWRPRIFGMMQNEQVRFAALGDLQERRVRTASLL